VAEGIRRRAALLSLAFFAGWGWGCGASGGDAGGDAQRVPANVVLITLDTVRADRLGAYGGPPGLTPHLDRLAARGVVFEQATSAAPLTLPSHATLLTGLEPIRHRLHVNGGGRLHGDVPTLATRLAAAGDRTGAFVASYVLDHRFGLARGFATYDDAIVKTDRVGALEAERPANEVIDRALDWLARGDSAPFFLWVHLYDAHAPYAPPEPYRSRFTDRPYDGEIAFLDAQVGRLLERLPERTVIAVTADHGEGLGEHGETTHGLLLHQSTLRVPLFVVAPGLRPRRIAEAVSLVDVASTLLGLSSSGESGASAPLPGRDLSRALLDGVEPPRATLLSETRYPATLGWAPLVAARRGRWKVIEAATGDRERALSELFDLDADAGETVDRALDARRELAELRRTLAESAAEAGDVRHEDGTALDREARAALASLGYAAPSRSPVATAGATDPRTQVEAFERYQEVVWARRRGDLATARRLVANLVTSAGGDNPVFLAEAAQVAAAHGDLRQAIAWGQRAADLAPRDPRVWYDLGMSFDAAGERAAAERCLDLAVRLDPGDPTVRNALGVVVIAGGDAARAEREFAAAAGEDPWNPLFATNHANALRALGRPAEAEAAYRRALAIEPENVDANNGLGALLVEADRGGEALVLFDRAIEANPKAAEPRLNRALALEVLGRFDEATLAYRGLVDLARREPSLAGVRQQADARLLVLSRRRPVS
jgi:arylsulfatase A-like enzyme/Flp pilus assembly protein TadD